jgi:hypothetical protein
MEKWLRKRWEKVRENKRLMQKSEKGEKSSLAS